MLTPTPPAERLAERVLARNCAYCRDGFEPTRRASAPLSALMPDRGLQGAPREAVPAFDEDRDGVTRGKFE